MSGYLTSINGTHQHVQETASATWTIEHNLDILTPIVDCWIEFNSVFTKVLPSSVTVVDANTVEVVFSSAQSGRAFVV